MELLAQAVALATAALKLADSIAERRERRRRRRGRHLKARRRYERTHDKARR